MVKKVRRDFKEWYRDQADDVRVGVRDEFLRVSGLSYPTWYAKMSAGGKFNRLELDKLGEICGERFMIED